MNHRGGGKENEDCSAAYPLNVQHDGNKINVTNVVALLKTVGRRSSCLWNNNYRRTALVIDDQVRNSSC